MKCNYMYALILICLATLVIAENQFPFPIDCKDDEEGVESRSIGRTLKQRKRERGWGRPMHFNFRAGGLKLRPITEI
jgi:hypothetical protein